MLFPPPLFLPFLPPFLPPFLLSSPRSSLFLSSSDFSSLPPSLFPSIHLSLSCLLACSHASPWHTLPPFSVVPPQVSPCPCLVCCFTASASGRKGVAACFSGREEGCCSSPLVSLLLQLALGAGRWEEGCSSLLGRKGAAPGGKGVPACFGGKVSGGEEGCCSSSRNARQDWS